MDKIKKYSEFLLISENISTNKTFSDKIINLLNMMVEKNSMKSIFKLNDKLQGSIIAEYGTTVIYFINFVLYDDIWYVRYTSDPTNTRMDLERKSNILLNTDRNFLEGLYELMLYKGSNIDSIFKQINGSDR